MFAPHVRNATLASGALDLFDVETFLAVSASMRRLGTLARCITIQGDSALAQLGAAPNAEYSGLSPEDC